MKKMIFEYYSKITFFTLWATAAVLNRNQLNLWIQNKKSYISNPFVAGAINTTWFPWFSWFLFSTAAVGASIKKGNSRATLSDYLFVDRCASSSYVKLEKKHRNVCVCARDREGVKGREVLLMIYKHNSAHSMRFHLAQLLLAHLSKKVIRECHFRITFF